MFETALQAAESLAPTRSSKYDELFTAEELASLDSFTKWLVEVCDFKPGSASSYRANFSRACEKLTNETPLNSDERSALRKFVEFVNANAAPVEVIEDELEEDEEVDDIS